MTEIDTACLDVDCSVFAMDFGVVEIVQSKIDAPAHGSTAVVEWCSAMMHDAAADCRHYLRCLHHLLDPSAALMPKELFCSH